MAGEVTICIEQKLNFGFVNLLRAGVAEEDALWRDGMLGVGVWRDGHVVPIPKQPLDDTGNGEHLALMACLYRYSNDNNGDDVADFSSPARKNQRPQTGRRKENDVVKMAATYHRGATDKQRPSLFTKLVACLLVAIM